MPMSLTPRYFTRKLRYRIMSTFSERAAYRLKKYVGMAHWEKEGYNYREIYKDACIIQATDAIYLPVSKSANTTMKHIISEEYPKEEMLIHSGTPAGISRLHDHRLTLDDLVAESNRCFTVVRHPIDRFISAFQDKVASPRLSNLKEKLWTFLDREMGEALTVDDLIAYMVETPPEQMDKHVCPQWACCGAGRIPFKMIGKVENLDRDVKNFAEIGLITPESIGRYALRNTSNYDYTARTLSRKQITLVSSIYAHDFKLFGY